MALDQETINAQLAQLALHRQRLTLLLQQQAKLGAYTPPYVLIDIQEAQSAIRRIKQQLRTDGVPVEDEPNDDLQPAAVAPPSRLSPQDQRNRRAMLAKVKAIWIEGLLEQSLAKELRIALDLTEQPDAVELPLNALVQELHRPSRPLPTGTPIIEVFDKMGGALLILGAPGAGKTTLLLELARDLIARAEQDEGHPIPVVFNLSSWTTKRRSLKEWLAEELNTKYDVPRKLAQMWIFTDNILPLLDGLDEVAADYRGACVDAINAYRQQHGLVPLTVCSRVADYDTLATKLRLQSAVLVLPLTLQQIDAYFESAGDQLVALRVALVDDAVLREFAASPLMFSIMTLAYRATPVGALPENHPTEEQRKRVFDAYVERMFARRGVEGRYTQEQTMQWLSWLAGGMLMHTQSAFYIEDLEPTWLTTHKQHQSYVNSAANIVRAVAGSVIGLTFGLIGSLIGGLSFGLLACLGTGLSSGWLFGSIFRPDDISYDVDIIGTLRWSWTTLLKRLLFGLILGLIWGLGTGLILELISGMTMPLAVVFALVLFWGPCIGLVWGLFFGLVFRPDIVEEQPLVLNESIWRSIRRILIRVVLVGLFIGPIYGLIWGILFGIPVSSDSEELLEIGKTSAPNQVIWRSIRTTALGAIFVGLFFGMLLGLSWGRTIGLVAGLFYGLLFVFLFNGTACSRHLALRLVLSRDGILPLRLVPFLDYCAERVFLRKVGGGYIFIHRLLMEHFASLYTEQSAAPPKR